MIEIYFMYFLIFLLLLAVFYATGNLVFRLFQVDINGFYTAIFAKFCISSTLFVLCTSIFYTKGLTVLILFVPLMLAFATLFWRKNPPIAPKKTSNILLLKQGLFLLFIAFVFFSLRFGQIYNDQESFPLAPHSDVVYYINCMNFLTEFGKENSSIDYVLGAKSGTSPYHYYELWFGAGVSRLFGLNTGLSYLLIVLSTSLFIIWLGICALMENFKKVHFGDALLCFLLVFTTGIAFHYYTEIAFMKYISVYTRNTWNYSKLFPLYFYTISSVLFFLRKKDTPAILCLLALPIVFISTALGIFLALATWFLTVYFLKKKTFPLAYVLTMATALGIFMFYNFFTRQTDTHVDIGVASTLHNLISFSFFKTAFNVFAGTTIQITILFAPFVATWYVFRKPNLKDIFKYNSVLLAFLMYFFALLGWSILHDKLSTVQVFSNLGVTLLNILACLAMVTIWSRKKTAWSASKILVIFLVIVGIKNSVQEYRYGYPQSAQYLNEVKKASAGLSKLGGFVFDKTDYAQSEFGYVSNFAILGQYLIYSQNPTFPLSLSPHSFPLSSEPKLAKIQEAGLGNTPFYIYVTQQKKLGQFESITKSQFQFMAKMKINYLIYSKKAEIPELIKKKIKREIVDQNTGERFYLLNP